MKRFSLMVGFACVSGSAVLVDVGCSGGGTNPDGGDDATSDVTADSANDSASDAAAAVTFSYTPQWSGVKKVEVVGGFGQASDWSNTQSFLSLTDDGSGKWSGSAPLPNGAYQYVFRVTGDDDTTQGATYKRYAVDPLDTSFGACPSQSPTYSPQNSNPCSLVNVPASAAAAPIHLKGTLVAGSGPAMGWIVEVEREESQSHHFFANRVTAGNDGSFDLIASAGSYRLQVLHPQFYKATDIQLDPKTLKTLRRAISSAVPLATSDVVFTTPDLAFGSYNQFAPSGAGITLPTQFTFETTPARLDIYGGPGDGGVVEIGDPWYASTTTSSGGASFGGNFNTSKAMTDAAVPGTRYMWGTEEGFDGSVGWTKQTLVFPITWQ